MMGLVFLLCKIIVSAAYDKQGVMFEDEGFYKLLMAPGDLEEYQIPASTKIITGGSIDTSAFMKCRDKLKTLTFAEGSQLETIEMFTFYNCSIEGILDLSPCTKLFTLSESVFSFCTKVTNLVLPPNIDTIKSGCFYRCMSLTSISFPKSLRVLKGYVSIHNAPFRFCTSLQSVTFDDDALITEIETDCFGNCMLSTFRIPSNVIKFSGSALAGNPLSRIEVDEKNARFSTDEKGLLLLNKAGTSIELFCGIGMTEYEVPDGIETLSDSAFRYMEISKITFPESLYSIGDFCFMNSSLTELSLGPSFNYTGTRVFEDCTLLTKVEWLANITTLKANTFDGCINLQEVIFTKPLRKLGEYTFRDCINIKYIFFPNTVEDIGAGSFTNINETANITFEAGCEMELYNNVLYTAGKRELISCLDSEVKEFTVLSQIERIRKNAFINMNLTSIDFSQAESLKKIDDNAMQFNSLKEIVFPKNLEDIGMLSFDSNPLLTTIDFSNCINFTFIGEEAFTNTKISNVVFPASIREIHAGAFSGLTSLTSISFDGKKSVVTIGQRCFANTEITSVIIPTSATNIMNEAFAGSKLESLIFMGVSEIETIGKYSFSNCQYLNFIDFGVGIKAIGQSAFENCVSLSKLTLSSSLENISINSFKGCTELVNVTIPDESNLSFIEGLAFENCLKLKSFNVSDNNQHFSSEDGVLYDKKRTEIILYLPASSRMVFEVPQSVIAIRAFSFQGAMNLRVANLSMCLVKDIGFKAFSGCSGLEMIVLPSTLEIVGKFAFENCNSLKCESVIFDSIANLYDDLVSAGIPKSALSSCITDKFTANGTVHSIFNILIMIGFLYNDEELV